LVYTSGQLLAPGLSIGERLPSIGIVRADDWRPLNVQDICPFDGRFRLIVLPGNMLHKSNVERLAAFSDSFVTAIGREDSFTDVMQTHIIILNDTSVVVESLSLPLVLVSGCYDR
jgi:phenol 2-monooxygenase